MHTKKILPTLALALALTGATTLAPADAAPHDAVRPAKAGSFQVTASVKDDEVLEGESVKIRGTVKPAAPGAQVSLQVRYADQKKWKTIGHTALRSDGGFRFKDEAGSVRVRKYRVVKAAGPTRAAGHSSPIKVTVFGWRNLDTLDPATSLLLSEGYTGLLNAVSYPRSLATLSTSPSPAHIDYNLNRDCTLLEAVYGLDDRTPTGATASLSVVADGVSKYAGTFSLAQAQKVTTDVTGVFRLTVNGATTGGGVAVVGTPRVLCSF